jgi:hypothetical protein
MGAWGFGEFVNGKDVTFTTRSDHAPRFNAGKYTATIISSQTPADPLKLTTGGQSLTCFSAHSAGPMTAATSSLLVGGSFWSFKSCTYAGKTATVNMNSCNFVFNVGSVGPPYSGSLQTTCSEEGDAIEITIQDFPSAGQKCVLGIQPQTATGSTAYENLGSGSSRFFNADLNAKISLKVLQGTGNCTFLTSGTITGTLTTSGWFEAEEVGAYLSGETPFGLNVEGSGGIGSGPLFDAERYPATISGSQIASQPLKLTTGGQSVACTTASFNGTAAAATSSLSLGATLAGCQYAGKTTTVSMNSCKFVFNVANAGPPYTGSLQTTCSKEGDAIEITIQDFPSAGQNCVLGIQAQTPGGSIGYTNRGGGFGRFIDAQLSVTKVALKVIKGTGNCTFLTSGNLSGGVSLHQVQ